jgi:hypothetical protein
MKLFAVLICAILLVGCNQANTSKVKTFAVPNKLVLKAKDTLGIILLENPPKALKRLALCSGDTVLKALDWDSKLKRGDTLKIQYPLADKKHYNLFAVSDDLQNEYYELNAHDFVVDLQKKSVINYPQNKTHYAN